MIPNLKYKTTYCHNYLQGIPCEKGSGCFFARGQNDLRSLQQNRNLIAQKNQVQKNSPQQVDNYKTIYCKFYSKGQCKLGKDCTFAHEKKQKRRKPKIKQQKNFQPALYYQNQMFPLLANNIPPQFNMYYPPYFNYFGMGYPGFSSYQQNQINQNSIYLNNQSQIQSNIIQPQNANTQQQQLLNRISSLNLNSSQPAQIKQQILSTSGPQMKEQFFIKQSKNTEKFESDPYAKTKDRLKECSQQKNKQNQMQKSNEKNKNLSLQNLE